MASAERLVVLYNVSVLTTYIRFRTRYKHLVSKVLECMGYTRLVFESAASLEQESDRRGGLAVVHRRNFDTRGINHSCKIPRKTGRAACRGRPHCQHIEK